MQEDFVFCDLHGNFSNLIQLLTKAEIISSDEERNFSGRVISVGDLGDFGKRGAGPTGDYLCHKMVGTLIDEVVVGNHEGPILGFVPFNGFISPQRETTDLVIKNCTTKKGAAKVATESNGFLITHAGITEEFAEANNLSNDPKIAAYQLNEIITDDIIGAVSYSRGGLSKIPGPLWRDALVDKTLCEKWPQIFGHTPVKEPLKLGDSYLIDNGSAAGIFLPSCKIVTV